MKPIFIHIPKTGGKSIQTAFGDDIVTIGHHQTARQIKAVTGDWDNRFKFTFVRNPWDRMVSTYHFKKRRRDKKVIDRTFGEWVLEVLCHHQRLTTQYDYVTENGKVILDFIGKFDNFQSDFEKLCKHLRCEKELPHVNQTSHKEYIHYYTDETKRAIASVFRCEIDHFGYKFGE